MSLFNWGKGQSTQESMHAAYFAEYERHRLLHLSDSLDNLAWREAQGRVRAAESRFRVAQAAPLGGIHVTNT
jgi:hypothetical protein